MGSEVLKWRSLQGSIPSGGFRGDTNLFPAFSSAYESPGLLPSSSKHMTPVSSHPTDPPASLSRGPCGCYIMPTWTIQGRLPSKDLNLWPLQIPLHQVREHGPQFRGLWASLGNITLPAKVSCQLDGNPHLSCTVWDDTLVLGEHSAHSDRAMMLTKCLTDVSQVG